MTPELTVRDPEFQRTCPVCESEVVEGQGLFACTVCEWTGTVTRARTGLHWVTDWR